MNHLKKTLLALAVLSLGLIAATTASAQQTTCNAGSVPTLVRSQGIAELMGSIVLNCTASGGTGSASLTASIQPPTAVITNNPAALAIPTASPDIDLPAAFLCNVAPAGNLVPTINIQFTNGAEVVNATCQGIVSGNTVTFPVPPCATVVAGACAAGTPVAITIGVVPTLANTVSIRANVAASGVVFPAQVSALITSSPAGTLSITNNILNVAIPQAGLASSTATSSLAAITQCARATLKGQPSVVGAAGAPGGITGFTATDPVDGTTLVAATVFKSNVVTAVEGFPSAWQPHTTPVTLTGDEGADATQGTRLLFRLSTLPTNVVLVLANQLTFNGGTLDLRLVSGAGADGSGGTVSVAGLAATVVTTSSFTYEVVASVTNTAETANIPVGLYTIGTPGATGTSTINVALGPISTVGTPVASPIPRFTDVNISGNFVAVVPCVTNILFPFVTNQAGYDTGFAVANTTTDPFGTASQSGTCVYNFYGTNGPSGGTFTTASFGGGTTDVQVLSKIAPGFQGYIIIQCNFQLGHGFDFIINGFGGGTPTVGQGGPGLIIFEPTATGTGSNTRRNAAAVVANGVFGEGLGH
jgi:hypothetical protein